MSLSFTHPPNGYLTHQEPKLFKLLFHKLTPQLWPHLLEQPIDSSSSVCWVLFLGCPFRSNATLSQTLLGLKCNRNPTPYPNPSYLLTMSQSISTVFTSPHWQGHCSASWCIPSPGTTCTAHATNKYPQTAQSTKSTWNSSQSPKNPFSGLTTPIWTLSKDQEEWDESLSTRVKCSHEEH